MIFSWVLGSLNPSRLGCALVLLLVTVLAGIFFHLLSLCVCVIMPKCAPALRKTPAKALHGGSCCCTPTVARWG